MHGEAMPLMDDEITRMIIEGRDQNRPTIELVVQTIGNAMRDADDPEIRVRMILNGPETWVWEDEAMRDIGRPKFYAISRSPDAETYGYPLLTIRQAYSERLGVWATVSFLVVGATPAAIFAAFSMGVALHATAYAGLRRGATEAYLHSNSAQAVLEAIPDISTPLDSSVIDNPRAQPPAAPGDLN